MQVLTLAICNFLNGERDPELHLFHFVLVKGIVRSIKRAWNGKEICGALVSHWGRSSSSLASGGLWDGEQERSNELFIVLC